jgi:hypothetical protein
MSNENSVGGHGGDTLEEQFHNPEGAEEAERAEFGNESAAYGAVHGPEYVNQVADVHAQAERFTVEAAGGQPAQSAASPAVERARADVEAIGGAPSPAVVPRETEAPRPEVSSLTERPQSVAQPETGALHQLKLLARDVRGLFYKGRHAAPSKSNNVDTNAK